MTNELLIDKSHEHFSVSILTSLQYLTVASLINLFFLGFHVPSFPSIHWPFLTSPQSPPLGLPPLPVLWMLLILDTLFLFSSFLLPFPGQPCLLISLYLSKCRWLPHSYFSILTFLLSSRPMDTAAFWTSQLGCPIVPQTQHIQNWTPHSNSQIYSSNVSIPVNSTPGHLVPQVTKMGIILHSILSLDPV